ncbi:MAG: glutathione peroxidase [Blastopirellula sp.]|nr:MAG: glutathione peroxidase [Blastopirellula sp.]
MRKSLCTIFSGLMICSLITVASAADKPSLLTGKTNTLEGKKVDLKKYDGKVLLIVNVASKCGATPQYKQLQALHEAYGEKGLVVMGFPCNQFGSQEPGSALQIREFCDSTYSVKFDMFAKIDVNGKNTSAIYKKLKSFPKDPGDVKWNFEKFLVDRDGNVIERFRTKVKPDSKDVIKAIETALAKD